jgi:hypothetical protein
VIKRRSQNGQVVERTLPAKVRLSWCISMGANAGRGRDHAVLSIEDESSNVQVLELQLTAEQLGRLVVSHSEVECAVTWRTERLGMRHEHKTEEVPFPARRSTTHRDQAGELRAAQKALEPFEVDGWEASHEDVLNSHNLIRSGRGAGQVYRVAFHRWVPIEEEAPSEKPPLQPVEPGKTYLEVVEFGERDANGGKKVVHRIDVTGKSERAIDKIEAGLLTNMNTDRFYVDRV